MRDFVAQRHNVLLCSTIIETGIDVPSANTIVISRADKFGLAQLHQLRGRVGRSHHQAYAYLLVPDVEGLTKQAAQRLEAIQQMEELGSGFYLAMHDLEIRGAGEVLGENQSGNMMEVGFQLYNDMLARGGARAEGRPRARPALAARRPPPRSTCTRRRCCPTPTAATCTRGSRCTSGWPRASKAEQIDALLEEITDRFGKLPPQGQTLFDAHRLRVLAKPYGVIKIDAGAEADGDHLPARTRRSTRCASSSWCRRTATSSWPATTSCASSATRPSSKDRAQLVRDVLRSLGTPTERRLAPALAEAADDGRRSRAPASWSAASRRRCASPTSA